MSQFKPPKKWPPGDSSSRQGTSSGATLCGREQDEEVGTASCTEPVSLKHGQRKRILDDILHQIDQLESNLTSTGNDESDDESQNHSMNPNFVQELFHLKLIGKVFSPSRFVEQAPMHGLRPGQAFDLRLGHQFLCAKQRRKCNMS